MALKPFYNKKGHLGMTRQEVKKRLTGGVAYSPAAYTAGDLIIHAVTEAEFLQLVGTGTVTIAKQLVPDLDHLPPTVTIEIAGSGCAVFPLLTFSFDSDEDPQHITGAIYGGIFRMQPGSTLFYIELVALDDPADQFTITLYSDFT